MAKWFVCEESEVSGPYDTDSLKKAVEDGSIGSSALVWGHPQDDWRSTSWWKSHLSELLNSTKQPKQEKLWHYVANQISHGPMKRAEVVEALKDMDERAEVMVWTNGMDDWLPLFEVTDLMEEIGISRRQHPRANIVGQVIIKKGETALIGQLKTVSAGGFGVTGLPSLNTGEVLHITLKSEKFYTEVRAQAEVRYQSTNGFTGFMFTAINSEEKAAIIDYVRSQNTKTAKAA